MTPDEKKMVQFSNINVSLVVAVAAVLTIGTFIWTFAQERSLIHSRIDKLDNNLRLLSDTVKKLAKVLDTKTSSRYTRTDYELDCLRHQILNPKWKCAYSPGRKWSTVVSRK